MYCPICGVKVDDNLNYCPRCGKELHVNGTSYNEPMKPKRNIDGSYNNQITKTKETRKKSNSTVWIILATVVASIYVGATLYMLAPSGSLSDVLNTLGDGDIVEMTSWFLDVTGLNTFETMYGDSFGNEEWCEISSDGKWMRLDTNPSDIESLKNECVLDVLNAITEINSALGFSGTVYEEIMHTAPIHGTKSQENDTAKITWAYSNDTGLVVIYDLK